MALVRKIGSRRILHSPFAVARRVESYENNPSVFLMLRSEATSQSSICVFCGLYFPTKKRFLMIVL